MLPSTTARFTLLTMSDLTMVGTRRWTVLFQASLRSARIAPSSASWSVQFRSERRTQKSHVLDLGAGRFVGYAREHFSHRAPFAAKPPAASSQVPPILSRDYSKDPEATTTRHDLPLPAAVVQRLNRGATSHSILRNPIWPLPIPALVNSCVDCTPHA